MPVLLFLLAFLFAGIAGYSQKEFDGLRGTHNWIEFSDAPNSLYHTIAAEGYGLLEKRGAVVRSLSTLAQWKERQRWVRKALQEAVGAFPAKTELHAEVVSVVDKNGYRVENILYQSRPGYFVTAGLFIPDGAVKAPAIVYCSGHSDNGYRSAGYVNEILNFVQKGFVVFAFDPMGQGERLQYLDPATGRSRFRWPAYEHSYCGAQLFITGNTLAREFIWDGIRAVDYLCTRKEVDAGRIGITGRSGGGTQSALIAAFDERIVAAAPENYITNMRRLFQSLGPQDAEQDLFYGVARGLDMADLLEVRAPKPMLVVATTQDMFPIQGAIETVEEVKRVYAAYGKAGNFGMVTDDAPHASTKKNREATYAFFQRALSNPGSAVEEKVEAPGADELRVTRTGQVSTALPGVSAFALNAVDAERRMRRLDSVRRSGPAYLTGVLAAARRLSGYREPEQGPAPWFVGRIQRPGYVIEKYLLHGEGQYMMPYIVLKPSGPVKKALLYLNPAGKAADVQEGGEMEWFVRQGVMVVAPDLVGIGELGPGEFQGDSYIDSVAYNLWFAAMLTGRSIVGIRAGDVVRIVNQLTKEGVSEVYGLAKRQMGPVLLHAAAFDKDIRKVALVGGYDSYSELVMDSTYDPRFLYSTVAGSIGVYDLPDLAASLAPRPVLRMERELWDQLKTWIE